MFIHVKRNEMYLSAKLRLICCPLSHSYEYEISLSLSLSLSFFPPSLSLHAAMKSCVLTYMLHIMLLYYITRDMIINLEFYKIELYEIWTKVTSQSVIYWTISTMPLTPEKLAFSINISLCYLFSIAKKNILSI